LKNYQKVFVTEKWFKITLLSANCLTIGLTALVLKAFFKLA